MSEIFALLGYVGPGAGMGALGALFGLIVSVLLALGVLLLWPVRMLLRKFGFLKPREPKPQDQETPAQQNLDA